MGFHARGLYSFGSFALLLASSLLLLQVRVSRLQAGTPVRSGLSCEDIYKITSWSQEHFGGKIAGDLSSEEWSSRSLSIFLKKLDPHKLLLTRAETDAFRAEGRRRWKALIAGQRCDFFETWAQTNLARARQRFEKTLAGTPVEGLFPSAPARGDASFQLPKHKGFAQDEAELQTRVRTAMKRVASTATPALIAAYGGDRAKLIRDTLVRGIIGENPVSPRVLLVKALLGALDQYSTYFSASEFEDFYHDLAGGTSGIGIRVRPVPGGLLIEKVLKDSPAEATRKIHAGDVITGIGRVALGGVTATAARALLKGGEHTKITLRLKAAAGGASRTVTVERQRIAFDDGKITGRLAPGTSVGVLDVPSFYGRAGRSLIESERSSAEDLRLQLLKLLGAKKKPSALVLDLRGNPGGFLEEAVSMAGYFVGARPVVAVVENHRKRVLKDPLARALYHGPLVVLVDDESASASEVLTGALKDYARAVVVGAKHTYGKGCVQRLFHLDDQLLDLEMGLRRDRGVVKLTTSVYYSPLGHSPANGGIVSDIALKMKDAGAGDDEETARVADEARVPEETPMVGDAILTEVQQRESTRRSAIDLLQRKAKLRAAVDTAAKKELLRDDASALDSELAQAVAIADDLAKLELKSDGPQVSRK